MKSNGLRKGLVKGSMPEFYLNVVQRNLRQKGNGIVETKLSARTIK